MMSRSLWHAYLYWIILHCCLRRLVLGSFVAEKFNPDRGPVGPVEPVVYGCEGKWCCYRSNFALGAWLAVFSRRDIINAMSA